MAQVKNALLPATRYNLLPLIEDVGHIPKDHASDIADLKALLDKHGLGDEVSVKLVHRHFTLNEGEIFVSRHIDVPSQGKINTMQTLLTSPEQILYGHHFYVDEEGHLAAYEFMEAQGPDLTEHSMFVQEFCDMVQDRGLRRWLGLSVKQCGKAIVSTNELEMPAKRLCIDVPASIDLPHGPDSWQVSTEFNRILIDAGPYSERSLLPPTDSTWRQCNHHRHCSHFPTAVLPASDGLNLTLNGSVKQIDLAGTKLDPASPLFQLVSYISVNA